VRSNDDEDAAKAAQQIEDDPVGSCSVLALAVFVAGACLLSLSRRSTSARREKADVPRGLHMQPAPSGAREPAGTRASPNLMEAKRR